MSSVARAVIVGDREKLAPRRLPKFVISHVGQGDGGWVMRNVEAFRRHRFAPRSFVDVIPVTPSAEALARRYAARTTRTIRGNAPFKASRSNSRAAGAAVDAA
jgi:hypothetical protein